MFRIVEYQVSLRIDVCLRAAACLCTAVEAELQLLFVGLMTEKGNIGKCCLK